MRLRAFLPLLPLLLLAACVTQAPRGTPVVASAPSLGAGQSRTVAFRCEGQGGLTARFQGETVRLFLPGRSVLLPQMRAASGARYAGGAGQFWAKGDEALLSLDGRQRRCVALEALNPWEEARLSGVSFRALGHEPAWLLEVRPGRAVSVSRGIPPVVAHWLYEPPIQGSSGRIWTLAGRQGSLTVLAAPRPCTDSMSGEAFTHAVTVITPTATVQGCGRDLE